MQIDWFTLVAEIINFLILVWLLQRFLYKPITNAMKEREQKIANRLDEAEQKRQRAEEEAEKYRDLRQELDEQRDDIFRKANEEADERRRTMIEEIREETDEMRRNWQLAVRQEKASFLNEMEQRVGQGAVDVARRVLADMADEQLETRVVDVFVERLHETSDDTKKHIKDAFQNERVRVDSAFELSDEDRQTVEEALSRFSDMQPELTYRVQPKMLCGIRVTTGEYEVSWSFEDYTTALRQQFEQVMDESTTEVSDQEEGDESEEQRNDDEGHSTEDESGQKRTTTAHET